MKKLMLILIMLSSCIILLAEDDVMKGKNVSQFPFYVYTDFKSKLNSYAPSGWMGDTKDIRLIDKWGKNPYVGKNCIRITYTAKKSDGAGWAGIYWQNPPNNWGTKKGGYDISKAKNLFFYARGKKGGEILEFKMGGIGGEYPDSSSNSTGVIELTKSWKLYKIELADLDLNYISGGFCVVFNSDDNPDGLEIYLDEIYYTDKSKPAIKTTKKQKI